LSLSITPVPTFRTISDDGNVTPYQNITKEPHSTLVFYTLDIDL
jgi:hypothetical protein